MAEYSVASPLKQPRDLVATDDYPLDSPLSGRAYPIRFDAVWLTALATAGALRGWTIAGADSRTGHIRAMVVGRLGKRRDEVSIRLSLDEIGLTRVDVAASPVGWRLRRGASLRHVRGYLRALDQSLGAAYG